MTLREWIENRSEVHACSLSLALTVSLNVSFLLSLLLSLAGSHTGWLSWWWCYVAGSHSGGAMWLALMVMVVAGGAIRFLGYFQPVG